jgi:Overcoming lysogenization defect protein-like, TOPRIM domain
MRPTRSDLPAGGPEATDRAVARAEGARAVILVEGFSDQIALETLAARRGRDLIGGRVAVVPIGGAQALYRFATRFGPRGAGLALAGLCDLAEEESFSRSLERAGLGTAPSRADLERLGFYVCVEDLEDELIRALGADTVQAVLAAHGDLGPFQTFRKQPAWRDRPVEAQLRRFMGSGDRRKLRYARLLVEALDLEHVPRPLDGALGVSARL